MRTARSRNSGENLTDFFMALSSQELEPPPNPGRFRLPCWCRWGISFSCPSLRHANDCEQPL